MYIPDVFRAPSEQAAQELIRDWPLATLVTRTAQGIEANPLPLLYEATPAGHVLIGHVSRGNPVWETYEAGSEALAIFQGPQHYISPGWYVSKHEHGRAVPTWNYATVHVYGELAFRHEPEWLLRAVTLLTDSQEAARAQRWRVTDAPVSFTDGLLKAIVGVELRITRLESKWKVSQNRTHSDRASTAQALEALGTDASLQMAALVRSKS